MNCSAAAEPPLGKLSKRSFLIATGMGQMSELRPWWMLRRAPQGLTCLETSSQSHELKLVSSSSVLPVALIFPNCTMSVPDTPGLQTSRSACENKQTNFPGARLCCS